MWLCVFQLAGFWNILVFQVISLSHSIKTVNWLILIMIILFHGDYIQIFSKSGKIFLKDYKPVVHLNTKL